MRALGKSIFGGELEREGDAEVMDSVSSMVANVMTN